MCTLVHKDSKPLVAEEDIIVYKLCEKNEKGDVLSIFFKSLYQPGVVQETEMKLIPENTGGLDREEFHAAIKKWDSDTSSVGEGFHFSFLAERLKSLFLLPYGIIVEFIVPKGALYYRGVTDLGVSNKIMLKPQN